uniref:Uncharacterized protein n=1 Tax=Anguilla anguilla TaxID=7936 RepID=A0A0E9XI91_ANGAN
MPAWGFPGQPFKTTRYITHDFDIMILRFGSESSSI